jgi:hypothetical protein
MLTTDHVAVRLRFSDTGQGGDCKDGCSEAVLQDSCFTPAFRYLIESADIAIGGLGDRNSLWKLNLAIN